ncbi:glycosyltransferase-like domain-containing protein 1 isoform X6 [Neoarius graeffei]|uniref:glycosyltransferase-like domain-containing protein 1 isoform X6 n=1 Tax=Neoarius graeffei TaxID=443677 RepID=UPI00298CAA7F|nr:glycosyltransferase-like domain-containing protein 1 isoform X6 [Neoarius graeffei]
MSVLLVEAFYGGSHKQLMDLLQEGIDDCVVYTLPAKKWHWRARTAALHFMQAIPSSQSYRILFTSSVLNLAELAALRPDLSALKKILYFHENQLIYPVRKSQDRDFQYGYNQILSCLVADAVLFNSAFNMDSFLSSISSFLKTMPDHRPKGLEQLIRPKCRVLYFPIRFPDVTRFLPEHKLLLRQAQPQRNISSQDSRKYPETAAASSTTSRTEKEQRSESDAEELEHRLVSKWSSDPERGMPRPLHIVWPHRWLEAVHCGCYPLCPKALVYPEIFPGSYLYSTPEQLFKRLQGFCKHPHLARQHVLQVNTGRFSWDALGQEYRSLLATGSRNMTS